MFSYVVVFICHLNSIVLPFRVARLLPKVKKVLVIRW